MRLLLVLNGPKERYIGGADDARAEVWGRYCSPGTELTIGYLPSTQKDGQPTAIYPFGQNNALTLANFYPTRCAQAEADGFDVIIILCQADPGLAQTRKVLNIPVIGPGEVTLRAAEMLSRRIGLTVPSEGTVALHEAQVKALGLEDRVVGMEVVREKLLPFPQQDSAVLTNAVVDAVARLVERGAEVICPQGLALIPLKVSAQEVSERVGVPVLDPALLSVKTAEMLFSAVPKITRSRVPA